MKIVFFQNGAENIACIDVLFLTHSISRSYSSEGICSIFIINISFGDAVQVILVILPGESWVDCVEILELWVFLRSFWLFGL